MKYDEEKIKRDILNFLYDNREASPQSLTKIRLAVELSDSKGDMRTLKESLEFLIKKSFIKKQVDRGNYKIEEKGIAYLEEE